MRRMRLICLALLFALLPLPALAQSVEIRRNVTVRSEPARSGDVVDFPAIGSVLVLLDDGARQHGYYHVRLPDGRTGWVYYTFVRRVPDQVTAATSGPDQVAVHFINVDQGNAALLEFPCGAVLIDAGGRGDDAARHLLAYLDAFFARRTDLGHRLAAIYVTHTHIDHNTNLRAVAGRYQVGAYIHNGLLNGSGSSNARWMATYVTSIQPAIPAFAVWESAVEAQGQAGLSGPQVDKVDCPRVDPKFTLLAGGRASAPGWSDTDFKNGNNHSLVIRVDYGSASFLFPGDLENRGITDVLSRYAGTNLLDIDVLEVNHHGAANGTTQDWMGALTPRIAVISMGPESIHDPWTAYAYGHPRKPTVDLLVGSVGETRPQVQVQVATGAKMFEPFTLTKAVYATGWDGDVTVLGDPAGTITVLAGQ